MEDSEMIDDDLSDKMVRLSDELVEIKIEIRYLREMMSRLIEVFNYRITDIYEIIDHIRQYGDNADYVSRPKIPIYDFFSND